MSVHLRVITPITTSGFRQPGHLKALETPGLEISHAEIATGPGSIETAIDDALAVPGTLVELARAEREGVDAAIIDCMADPGMNAGRELVRIPVIGPSQTSMLLAAMLGDRFSVITVLPRLRYQFERLARHYHLETALASVRSVDIPVLELEADLEATKRELIEQAIIAVETDKADALIFGCTGLLGCAAAVREGLLARGLDVPVIDPIPAAVKVARSLVELGLAHSKTAFAEPLARKLVGYPLTLGPTAEAAE
jgi:allantoin racemase